MSLRGTGYTHPRSARSNKKGLPRKEGRKEERAKHVNSSVKHRGIGAIGSVRP